LKSWQHVFGAGLHHPPEHKAVGRSVVTDELQKYQRGRSREASSCLFRKRTHFSFFKRNNCEWCEFERQGLTSHHWGLRPGLKGWTICLATRPRQSARAVCRHSTAGALMISAKHTIFPTYNRLLLVPLTVSSRNIMNLWLCLVKSLMSYSCDSWCYVIAAVVYPAKKDWGPDSSWHDTVASSNERRGSWNLDSTDWLQWLQRLWPVATEI
jgi:hypothetical protein